MGTGDIKENVTDDAFLWHAFLLVPARESILILKEENKECDKTFFHPLQVGVAWAAYVGWQLLMFVFAIPLQFCSVEQSA